MGKLATKLLGIWRRELPPPVEARPDLTMEALAAEVSRLRAAFADLQLQWAEVLDKIAAWGNRQAARDRKRVGKALVAPESDEYEEVEPAGGPPANGAPPAPPAPQDGFSGKGDLYARMRARGIK